MRVWDEDAGAGWVDQTILHDPDRPDVIGNCWQACIASLLRLPLDEVPHFAADHEDWAIAYNATRDWVRGRGFDLMFVGDDQIHGSPIIGMLTGRSPRGVNHVVVGRGDQMLHDPHPSRAGLVSIEGMFLLVAFAPFLTPAPDRTREDDV